jgi:hypothetical protein
MRYSGKRGKRGGKDKNAERDRQRDIHSKIEGLPNGTHKGHAHNLHGSSATNAALDAAKYFDLALVGETEETHVIPRHSATRQNLLGIVPPDLEFERIPTRRISRQWDKRLRQFVEVSDEIEAYRVVGRSDRTLLKRGNPFKDAEDGNKAGYKRQGVVAVGLNTRSYTEAIQNADPYPEKVIGLDATEELQGTFSDDPIPEQDATATAEDEWDLDNASVGDGSYSE